MSPEELRAEAVWLQELVGWECPWPIETAHDLREYASNVSRHEDVLTGAELRRVHDLIDRLAPPEERRREKKRRQEAETKAKARFEAWLTRLEQRKALPARGTAARKQKAEARRANIIRLGAAFRMKFTG